MASGEHAQAECPFCDGTDVDRLYLASLRVDSCVCRSCGARWDQDALTGEFRGRQSGSRTTRSSGESSSTAL